MAHANQMLNNIGMANVMSYPLDQLDMAEIIAQVNQIFNNMGMANVMPHPLTQLAEIKAEADEITEHL